MEGQEKHLSLCYERDLVLKTTLLAWAILMEEQEACRPAASMACLGRGVTNRGVVELVVVIWCFQQVQLHL